jgi:hypothetical protein
MIYDPQPIEVRSGENGLPRAVAAVAVEAVREEWIVEDRWWAGEPISRRYFELVLADGRCVVIFRERGSWFGQRA